MKRKVATELTEEEIKFLRSERAAPSVREFTSRQHEAMGVRTSAYAKVARAARAERDAIVEIAALELARAVAQRQLPLRERVESLEQENAALRANLDAVQTRLEIASAAPAMAVHSEGSR